MCERASGPYTARLSVLTRPLSRILFSLLLIGIFSWQFSHARIAAGFMPSHWRARSRPHPIGFGWRSEGWCNGNEGRFLFFEKPGVIIFRIWACIHDHNLENWACFSLLSKENGGKRHFVTSTNVQRRRLSGPDCKATTGKYLRCIIAGGKCKSTWKGRALRTLTAHQLGVLNDQVPSGKGEAIDVLGGSFQPCRVLSWATCSTSFVVCKEEIGSLCGRVVAKTEDVFSYSRDFRKAKAI